MVPRSFRNIVIAFLVFVLVSAPLRASAGLIGGQVGVMLPCFNIATWETVGGPKGGIFIWTPFTRTYANGPPAPGKWILGISGLPYFCLTLIAPLWVIPGISISMMGSSGASSGSASTPSVGFLNNLQTSPTAGGSHSLELPQAQVTFPASTSSAQGYICVDPLDPNYSATGTFASGCHPYTPGAK